MKFTKLGNSQENNENSGFKPRLLFNSYLARIISPTPSWCVWQLCCEVVGLVGIHIRTIQYRSSPGKCHRVCFAARCVPQYNEIQVEVLERKREQSIP